MAAPVVHPSMFAMLGIITLVLWRMYSRIRRMVGRQKLRSRRLWTTLVVFPLLLVLLMLTSIMHPSNALYLCSGAAVGALLGIYGLRLTRFEVADNGLFYTPNAHLGIALSLVFVGRIVYRLLSTQMAFQLTGDASVAPPMSFASSPLTLIIFATLAGYYVSYAIGLLRWSRAATAVASGVAVESESARTDQVGSDASIDQDHNESENELSDDATTANSTASLTKTG